MSSKNMGEKMQSGSQDVSVDELYATASNASDLRVEADRRSRCDVLIAVGWSPSRLGAALLRLYSEWDAAAKPVRPTRQSIESLAQSMPRVNGRLNMAAATQQLVGWYTAEVAALASRMRTLPSVQEHLQDQASAWGIEDAKGLSAAVVRAWLDGLCGACAGRRWQLVSGAPALSNRVCPVCRGTGLAVAMYGRDGRRLLSYMDDCVFSASRSIGKRLRSSMKRD